MCDTPHLGGKTVIAAGTGNFIPCKQPSDYKLRYAQFVTIDSNKCSDKTVHKNDPYTIICAYENMATGQTTSNGDSGNLHSLHMIYHISKEFNGD